MAIVAGLCVDSSSMCLTYTQATQGKARSESRLTEQLTCQLQSVEMTRSGAPHRMELFAMKLHTATLMSVGVQIELVNLF